MHARKLSTYILSPTGQVDGGGILSASALQYSGVELIVKKGRATVGDERPIICPLLFSFTHVHMLQSLTQGCSIQGFALCHSQKHNSHTTWANWKFYKKVGTTGNQGQSKISKTLIALKGASDFSQSLV
jgi:hypothetical protein